MKFFSHAFLALSFAAFTASAGPNPVPFTNLPTATGVFAPTWQSLAANYRVPEWFRDAKFGIWSHWGPQAVPGEGDWYARNMYLPKNPNYQFHATNYGHPSQFGYKDILPLFKAEKFDADAQMKLFKRAGAKYFFALANHHDNYDCFDSAYQPWNSVNIGPHKDLVGLWAKAAKQEEQQAADHRRAEQKHEDRRQQSRLGGNRGPVQNLRCDRSGGDRKNRGGIRIGPPECEAKRTEERQGERGDAAADNRRPNA